jgi:hypothetical protein
MSKGLKIMSLGVINHDMSLSVLYTLEYLTQVISNYREYTLEYLTDVISKYREFILEYLTDVISNYREYSLEHLTHVISNYVAGHLKLVKYN